MRVLIVGCGYIGSKLGSELVQLRHEVFGVQRTSGGEAALRAAGIVPIRADTSFAESCASLPRDCNWVVLCLSSKSGDVAEYERTYLQSTRNHIDLLAKQPLAKFVYTSSTSVYGQNDGSLVDETAPTRPDSPTAQVLVRTEALLTTAATERAFPAVV